MSKRVRPNSIDDEDSFDLGDMPDSPEEPQIIDAESLRLPPRLSLTKDWTMVLSKTRNNTNLSLKLKPVEKKIKKTHESFSDDSPIQPSGENTQVY